MVSCQQQRLSNQDAVVDAVMPPADNVVQNWGFESGSSSWQFGGSLTGMITSVDGHSGAYSAFLGSETGSLQRTTMQADPGEPVSRIGTESMPSAGEAAVKSLRVPAAAPAPTLSFLHRFGTGFPSDSRLEVVVDDGISSTTVFSATTGTDTWVHEWADLTPWAGRSVTLRFKVIEVAGGAHAWAYIDEVTVGSAHPDLWVSRSGRNAAPPGQQIVQDVIYGNRGGAAASNGHVTLHLPPELTFVSGTRRRRRPHPNCAGTWATWRDVASRRPSM